MLRHQKDHLKGSQPSDSQPNKRQRRTSSLISASRDEDDPPLDQQASDGDEIDDRVPEITSTPPIDADQSTAATMAGIDAAIDPMLWHVSGTSLPLNQDSHMRDESMPQSYVNGSVLDASTGGHDRTAEAWNLDFESHFPSWMINETIDLGLFDSPLASTMAELGHSRSYIAQTVSSPSNTPIPSLQGIWHTHMQSHQDSPPGSGTATPVPAQSYQTEIDDEYRRTLHSKLQIRSLEHASLPSSDFLNLCVRAYFSKFHPIFPVIHAPTFRPSKANSLLLLSICSVGSLFTGSVNAAAQGVHLFERIQKAVLASWERLLAKAPAEVVPTVLTALIGQTFGLLSGNPKHLATVDCKSRARLDASALVADRADTTALWIDSIPWHSHILGTEKQNVHDASHDCDRCQYITAGSGIEMARMGQHRRADKDLYWTLHT